MSPKLTRKKLLNEHNLLDSFVKADSEILFYFYETHLQSVIKYVCKNGGNDDDALVIFKEALMVLYKQAKSGKLDLSVSLKTYIFSICRYQWLKSIRKNGRIESLDEGIDLIDLNSDIVRQIERSEKFRLLQDRLLTMSDECQKILNLHFQKYLTEEIASNLGLSPLEVKKRKYDCKKKLIESIQKESPHKE